MDIDSILSAPHIPLPFVTITDDEILAVLLGETVTIQGPKYAHKVSFVKDMSGFSKNDFRVEFDLGVCDCNEENLRLIRFI